MNKTVNINLGGLFFHIDENAYQKLTRYFDAIKRSLSNASGQDEIMKDIEMRIAEIFSEQQISDKHVIGLKEVDAMIAIMGQPEDYRLEEEGETQNTPPPPYTKTNKKLYRDIDNNILGGVAAGFGHYLGIEAIWIRLILVILLFASFFTFVFIYLLLWILIPKAITTSEKLEMTGEPVNLSNIEKKIREEYENIEKKIENIDYQKLEQKAKTGAEEIGSAIGGVFMTIFTIFAKFLGALIVLISITTLASLFIGLFVGTVFGMPWQDYVNAAIYTDLPLWALGLITFFAVGIPFFAFLMLGLRLLISNMKPLSNVITYTLVALWIVSLSILITFGVSQANERAFEGKLHQKEYISITSTDTLEIKMRYNEQFSNDVFSRTNFDLVQNVEGKDKIYSNNVKIRIKSTEDASPFITIERRSDGKSISHAKNNSDKIEYQFDMIGNKLTLDNYFLTDIKNRYRNQKVIIILNIPDDFYVKPNKEVQSYIRPYSNDMEFSRGIGNKTYKVENQSLQCINCPQEEEHVTSSDDMNETTIRINNKGVQIKKSNTKVDEDFKGLKIDKDGIIIKTN
jgi:phage shock protein PspC (stress-responsive transcriptional regulator)